MFTVCVVFMSPHFNQLLWLTDSPRVPDKSERVPAVTASTGPPGTEQPQRKDLGKGQKGQSLQWCHYSKSRALPWMAEAGVTRGHQAMSEPQPTLSPPLGPGQYPSWSWNGLGPNQPLITRSRVEYVLFWALYLFSWGLPVTQARAGWGRPRKGHLGLQEGTETTLPFPFHLIPYFLLYKREKGGIRT